MDVTESCHWVVSLSQIPHVEARVLVVVIGNNKLSCHFWVPHHAGSLGFHVSLLLGGVIEVILSRS